MSGNIYTESLYPGYGFSFIHYKNNAGNTVSHIDKDLFSIIMPISGETDYDIEGKHIHITPNDILIVGNNEFHRNIIENDNNCEYMLLMINLDFFIKNNCTEFSEMVFNRTIGDNNVIPAHTVIQYGIDDIFKRLDRYCSEDNPPVSVIKGVIVEMLYNLNKHVIKTKNVNYIHEKTNDIIAYINDNVTEHISLNDIASRFFITKQHLCKIFKTNTGFTINEYISYKRIALVREAYYNGMTLSQACYKAGFSDYSSFYRAYSKLTNESPKRSLSKK